MSRRKLNLLNFMILLMTVPWFFNNTKFESIMGFPYWAFYSLFLTLLYAIIIFYFLGKYWSISKSDGPLKK